jgi:two-component system KDP operon response regulator KdpE
MRAGKQNVKRSSRSAGQFLIVTDKPSQRRLLHASLFAEGFDVGEAGSGDEAIALCRIVKYDAVLLNANMPGKGAIETCVSLQRLNPRLAVLMLSASEDRQQMVAALESGADDFIIVPRCMRELNARLRATLRRTQALAANSDDVITIGDVTLHSVRRVLQKRNSPIYLTPMEFSLLHYLMAHAGLPIPHSRLLQAVWGPEFTAQVECLRTYYAATAEKVGGQRRSPLLSTCQPPFQAAKATL